MPRPANTRKDLSAGWKRLHRLWELPLRDKTEMAHDLLQRVLENHNSPVVCWSGGKDSGVVLHLVLQHRPKVPVIYVDTGVEFPETRRFVKRVAQLYKLNTFVARPAAGLDFWSIGLKYGWPLFGKNVSSNVERARRTGRLRYQLSNLERQLVENNLHISCKCSDLLQELPSKMEEAKLGCDLKIVGLRAAESRARVRLWVDHGDYHYVKRYFGRGRGIWKVNPIAIWTDSDIWEYHENYGLPSCVLYRKGYPRNGCWACGMAIRNGQLSRLRRGHPKLFEKLLLHSAMGSEIVRAAKLIDGKAFKANYTRREIQRVLDGGSLTALL